ncbi:MAG TPA: pitrilysin family protein [Gemmatimonadales bacterium]|jgi:zinc protease
MRISVAPALVAACLAALPAGTLAAQALHVPYETFTLPNGLTVIVHTDSSVPIVAVNTWYHVGSGDEHEHRTGFAHLFEHIMFMGSQHVPTGRFDQLLEAAGADNNGSTTEDRTNYYEVGPSNATELMLYLDSDRMGFLLPEITAEKVDLQRGVVQNERRQSYDNQPYGLAEENILSRLYPPGHPYSWPVIGSMTDLSAASLDDVRNFFRTNYAPNNATITIAGAISAADARRLVEKWFGEIPRGPADVQRNNPAPFSLEHDVYGTIEDHVQLPRLYNAWHTVRAFNDDDAALSVMADILASGRSSRLYKTLVYDKQIATQVTAYHDALKMDGSFRLFSTARPGHDLNELQHEIDAQIRLLADSGPTQREVQRVQNQTEAQFLGEMERDLGKANQLNEYQYFVGIPDYFQQDLDRYRHVTTADVQRVARQYITGAHRVVLSVVPQGKQNLAASQGVTP